MAEMDIEDYLRHRTGGGGRASYLSKWKDREAKGNVPAAAVDVWLHTRAPIGVVWRHNLPRIVLRDSQDQRGGKSVSRRVWSQNPVCWEDEQVLKSQYKRDDDGNRRVPPTICPLCMLIEWVREQVETGKLDWLAPVLAYEGSDPRESQVVRAGGLYNAYSADDLSPDEVAAMNAQGVYAKHAWKQNAMPKASAIFRVVDHHAPGDGVQIAIETALLGDKVKTVVLDAIERKRAAGLPPEQGNPQKHPYAIRLQYRKDEQQFDKKYHALAMEYRLSPEVERLIRETDPPEIRHLLARFNAASLRAELEKAAQIAIPWDRFFAAAEAAQAGEPAAQPQGSRAPRAEPERQSALPSPAPEESVACDACGKPHPFSASRCPHCGHAYDVEEQRPEPPPAPPKILKRSEARKLRARQQESAPTPQVRAAPDPDPGNGDAWDDEGIPF